MTHEHADFDAVASQLAAHRLVPSARPVLPARCNRNVRHFVRLYWDELPFVEMKDLPREPVARAIIVDTQHVQTLRGIGKKTAVEVIDHHAPRESLPAHWQVTIDEVGASTTLLCERLKDTRVRLTPIEATLLALGIYEDTGSLSYGTTTARDVYAAAWLIEQGAATDVVREFLHHALADDQIALYEQLLEKAETHLIEGHPVVIAAASAPEMVEEIATLAHKLRDVLDPSALFLLVHLGTHIQMVARSSVDAIDVGMVAEEFGGGGHGRAAAAIIRDTPLSEARNALLDALPRLVRPSVTVADLMSHGVQTLTPDTPARDAAALMRRYGYEGFPIVLNGEIAGLLTRRAVDRAMDHGLTGIKVSQIMEAGLVSVRPNASMGALQRIMMTSGWGQVPVVDDEGKILGVVTRTDLIKHLGHTRPAPRRRVEIIRRMEEALPPILVGLLRAIGKIALEQGLEVFVVGGSVRDLLLGQATIDLDFVVEGDAIRLTRALQERFGGDMRSHGRFGTGKWLIDEAVWRAVGEHLGEAVGDLARLPTHIDFVTARTEFYRTPTALPEVEQASIKHDLHRRDFTINTLAIRLNPQHFGQLLDFYGGEADLREGRLRVLHSISFYDDPTRILRAVRLEQRLGFQIEARTAQLIEDAIPLLEKVSGDRIRHEIEAVLAEAQPEDALCRLDELGILWALHPALRCDAWLRDGFAALRYAHQQPVWAEIGAGLDVEWAYFGVLAYRLDAAALHDVCRRIKVQRRTLDDLERLARIRDVMDKLAGDLRPSEVDRLLAETNDRILAAAWAAAPTAAARDHIVAYAREWRTIRPEIDGNALRARGLAPGPEFRRLLGALRTARLDGAIKTREEEEELLARLLEEEHR